MYCYYCDIETDDRYCPACERDAEGLTWKDRQKKRPRHETIGAVRAYKSKKRKTSPLPFADAVVPGSVRVSGIQG